MSSGLLKIMEVEEEASSTFNNNDNGPPHQHEPAKNAINEQEIDINFDDDEFDYAPV